MTSNLVIGSVGGIAEEESEGTPLRSGFWLRVLGSWQKPKTEAEPKAKRP